MTKNEKAVAQLESCGITSKIENNVVYVYCGDTPVEISDYEINFRAHLYDTHKLELPKTN